MLPDVVRDNITDCAQRQGFLFVEQVFFEAAKREGFRDAKDRAMALHRLWSREGYVPLPDFVKDYVLQTTNQFHGNAAERI